MSRVTGYAGVSNLLGQRFLTDSEALSPILTYLNRRGLYFFDNGAASQSVVPVVASQVGIPAAQSGPALDSVQNPAEIDRRLSEKLPLQLNVFIDPTQTGQTPQPEARSPGRDAAGAQATP